MTHAEIEQLEVRMHDAFAKAYGLHVELVMAKIEADEGDYFVLHAEADAAQSHMYECLKRRNAIIERGLSNGK